ncbi:MAG: M28 family peptidase [Oscillospiraceae bacterium]|nr:M28 family peptidase [Oscillospiraceae bacterium]
MIAKPIEILQMFPVRKTKDQKQSFRDAVQVYAEGLGYPVAVEKGSFGSQNVIIGDPKTASFLVTAHYDTCVGLPVPNLITPCNPLLYIGYQLFVTVVMCFIPALVYGAAWFFLRDTYSAFLCAYFTFLLELVYMRVGAANPSNANDNTSGVVTVLEIARSMPENRRERVCFVLFDQEESGLKGSKSYRKIHKEETDRQIILNMDCVGDGDQIMFFPTRKLKKDRRKLNPMFTCCGQFGEKNIAIRDKGFSVYPSDQNNFPYGTAICALHKGKLGLYFSRIHTPKDTVLEETNVNLLRAALTTYITCTESERKECL